MFTWNDELLHLYVANHPDSKEKTFVDFGQVPEDLQVRDDWRAEVTRFLRALASRGYQCDVAMYDGGSGLSPLYTVSTVRVCSTPVDLADLECVLKLLCLPGQTIEICERVLGIQVLPDISLDDFLARLSLS